MKKTFVTISTGFLLAFGSFTIPMDMKASAQEVTQSVQEGKVISGVKFRTAPSLDSRVMGTLPKGTEVEVLEKVNAYWLKVHAYNTTGYVSTRYVTILEQVDNSPTNPIEPENVEQEKVEVGADVSDKIIQTGLDLLSTPYQFGARTGQTTTFDCSSFTQYIFGENGIELPRSSRQQATVGTSLFSKNDLQKGDLIFFKTGNRSDSKIDHVAVYMGDGEILHAIPRGGVQVDNLSGFWLDSAVAAKRVLK
jgi:cell wall-associated NlpC family hydrolase